MLRSGLGCGWMPGIWESGLVSILWIRPGSRPTRSRWSLAEWPTRSPSTTTSSPSSPCMPFDKWRVHGIPRWLNGSLLPAALATALLTASIHGFDGRPCSTPSGLLLLEQAGPWLGLRLISSSQHQATPQDSRLHSTHLASCQLNPSLWTNDVCRSPIERLEATVSKQTPQNASPLPIGSNLRRRPPLCKADPTTK